MPVSQASTARSCGDPREPSEDQFSREVRMAIVEFGRPMYPNETPNRFGTSADVIRVSPAERFKPPPTRPDPDSTHRLETSCTPPETAAPPKPSTRDSANGANAEESSNDCVTATRLWPEIACK